MHTTHKFLFSFLFILLIGLRLGFEAFAQSPGAFNGTKDSIDNKNSLYNLAIKYSEINITKAYSYAEKLEALAKKKDDPALKIFADNAYTRVLIADNKSARH